AEQVREVVVAPLGGRRGPDHLDAAGDGVTALARSIRACPAEALLLDAAPFRLRPYQGRGAGAMRFAEGVAAGNQRDRLFVVHRQAAERLANAPRRRGRVRLAVRPFRIDVDQAHLHGAEIARKLAVATVTFVRQPLAFGAPVDVLFGLPHIRAPAAETEGLET